MTAAQQLEILMFVAGIIAGTFGYAFASRYTIAREKYIHSHGYASRVQRRGPRPVSHLVLIFFKASQETNWHSYHHVPNGSLVEIRDGIATVNGKPLTVTTRLDWRFGHAE